MPEVIFAPLAVQDLDEIWDYIARDDVEAANGVIDRITEVCQMLATQPEMGLRRPEFAGGNLRSFVVGNFIVFYRPVANGIEVARVVHGSRDIGRLIQE
jgi:toxin ParE1/3/4